MKCTKCLKAECPKENRISRYGMCNKCFEGMDVFDNTEAEIKKAIKKELMFRKARGFE